MHEIETAATHFYADVLSRCKCIIARLLINEFHRQQVIRLCALLHDCIATAILHILLVEAGLIDLVILSQRTVSI